MAEGPIELPVCLCMCVCVLVRAYVCPILVRSITSTFNDGFQNNFAHKIMRKACFDTLKFKITVEVQKFKLTLLRE